MDEKDSILIVDDEEGIRKTLSLILRKKGYEVETAATGRDALEKAQGRFFNIALLDIKLPDMAGVELLEPLKEMHPDMVQIMVTAHASAETAIDALNRGATAYITKPLNIDEVLAKVKDTLEKQHLIAENRGLLRDLQEELAKRKRSDTALRNSEEKMRQLFRSATDGIFTLDLNGVYTEVNERMLELLSVGFKDQILGKKFLQFVNAPDIKMAIVEMQRTLDYGTVMHLEYTSLRADFSEFHAELNGAPLRDAANRPVGFVGILRDITERKKIATMKSGYISIISHQLKTPVLGIKMGIENMLEGLTGDLTTKQKQYLKAMYEICSRNHRLVNALINVSIIDRGELFVDIEPVKLMEIVDLALVDYRNDIRKKGLTLNIEEVDKGIVVLADIDKMVEALSNVINNAVKFTDKGSIAIRITDGLTTESKYAIVEVRDTGTGMSDEVLNNLLTRRKVLSGPPIASDGVGIGLWIAKSFMEAQRGDVRATSVAGEGSTFVLRVPRVLRGQSEKTHEVKEYEHHQ